jgi:hypothetical protein
MSLLLLDALSVLLFFADSVQGFHLIAVAERLRQMQMQKT